MKSEARNKTRTRDAVVTRDARLCGVTEAAVNTRRLWFKLALVRRNWPGPTGFMRGS